MLKKYLKNVSLKGCQIIRQPGVPTARVCLDQPAQITKTVEQTSLGGKKIHPLVVTNQGSFCFFKALFTFLE